jgi:hypothetical protein
MGKPRAFKNLSKERVMKFCKGKVPAEKIAKVFGWDSWMPVTDFVEARGMNIWEKAQCLKRLGIISAEDYLSLHEIWSKEENSGFSKYLGRCHNIKKSEVIAQGQATKLVKKVILRHLNRLQSITSYKEENE